MRAHSGNSAFELPADERRRGTRAAQADRTSESPIATVAPETISRNQVLAIGALIVIMYMSLVVPNPLISILTDEGGAVEWLGFVSLFAAGILFFLVFLRARRRGASLFMKLFLLGLAAALLIGAAEELSWGQRVRVTVSDLHDGSAGYAFDIQTPEQLAENNRQGELNFHNLSVAGDWGVWRAFEIFTLMFAVVLPLAVWRRPSMRSALARYVPIIPLTLCGLFLLTQVMVVVAEIVFYFNPGLWHGEPLPMYQGRSEVTETSFALLYAVAAFDLAKRSARSRERPDPA